MRIGIYTQPLRYNYGCLLQAWALQTVLRRMGHDVVTFDPCPYLSLPRTKMPFVYAKRAIKKIYGQNVTIRREEKFNREHDLKIQNLKSFIDANIQKAEFTKVTDIKEGDFDVLMAGSDQVWRPKYNRSYGRTIENAFFDFAQQWKHVKRIAYAASFGTDDWEFTNEQTTRCSELAKLFSAISVREQSGIALCKERLGVTATHVLDPTMLLDRKNYEELIAQCPDTHSPSGNLLCYILDETEQTTNIINHIAKEKGLTPFRANSKVTDKNADISEKIQPPVEQWLRNFKDAELVVTDSFHACVFSIIFGKPFVVIGNKNRGISRYESLFAMLSMDVHPIFSVEDVISMNTNYDEVYYQLDKQRNKSICYLEQSLDTKVR